MNIAIIGCGYVGTALANFWSKQGHQLTTTTRSISKLPSLKSIPSTVLLMNENTSADLVYALQLQNVIIMSVAADSPSVYENTYLKIAQFIVEALAHAPSVHSIIYTSSTSVYGDHQGGWIDETSSPLPANPQANVLLEAEKMLLSCQKKERNVCIFRLGEIYGPHREIAYRLKKLQNRSLSGTGLNFTNIIHLSDIVGAMNFALKQKLHGVYNLVNDLHVPRKDLYEQLCKKHGFPSVHWNSTLKSLHSSNKKVSNLKIKQAGYVLNYPLEFF